jgi:hypothetical protein
MFMSNICSTTRIPLGKKSKQMKSHESKPAAQLIRGPGMPVSPKRATTHLFPWQACVSPSLISENTCFANQLRPTDPLNGELRRFPTRQAAKSRGNRSYFSQRSQGPSVLCCTFEKASKRAPPMGVQIPLLAEVATYILLLCT